MAVEGHNIGEPYMKEVTTVGLDIAKHVFQAYGITARGETIGPAAMNGRIQRPDTRLHPTNVSCA